MLSSEERLVRGRRSAREYRRRRRQTHPTLIAKQKAESNVRCRDHVREYQRAWSVRNVEKNRASRKRYRWRIRLEMIAAYGGQCVCCGEAGPWFLTIDHIHNDGVVEREGVRTRTGTKFYLDLRRRGWPKDRYQLLCSNCNSAKGQFGVCPHQQRDDGAGI